MSELLKMDFKLFNKRKKYLLIQILIIIGFFIYKSKSDAEVFGLLFMQAVFLGTALYISLIIDYEKLNGYDIRKDLLSLPVSRKDYVFEKVILFIILLVFFIVESLLVTNIIRYLYVQEFYLPSLDVLKLSIYHTLKYGSIIFVIRHIGDFKYESAVMGGLMGIFVGSINKTYTDYLQNIIDINFKIIIAIIFFVISYFVSYYFFNRRDLA